MNWQKNLKQSPIDKDLNDLMVKNAVLLDALHWAYKQLQAETPHGEIAHGLEARLTHGQRVIKEPEDGRASEV